MIDKTTMINDKRQRYFVQPTRVVWQDEGSGKIEASENLLAGKFDICTLAGGKGEGPSLILDFGRELNGGISLSVHLIEPAGHPKIRLRFGESVSEVMAKPNADHAYHDIVLDTPRMSTQEFGLTGFRFVRLDLLDDDAKVQLREVRAVALERPWKCEGQFECSDTQLNEIWKVAARTVHLCAQEYILDGIKRDRLVWMGDIHPQFHVLARVFGQFDIIRESLDYMRDQPSNNGWLNEISSYSLWWVITQWEAYLYTGDKEYLAGQRDYIANLFDLFAKQVDENGNECFADFRFLDWASASNEKAVSQGLHTLLIWAIRDAVLIADNIGEMELKDKYQSLLDRLVPNAPTDNFANKQAGAISVLGGIAEAEKTNKDILAPNPCDGLSPWCGYYVLNARALAGDYKGCLDLIREYWGGMLKLGATSFWEHFDVAWLDNAGRIDEIVPEGKHDVHVEYGEHCYQGLRHSLCHGWGGGPSAWLCEYILGIKIMAPGMTKISIEPNLGDLDWAKGSMPTPFGPITVSHKRNADGTIETECELPEGVVQV